MSASAAMIPWGEDLIVASDAWAPEAQGKSVVTLFKARTGQQRSVATATRSVSSLASGTSTGTNGVLCFVGGGALSGDYPKSEPSELLQFQDEQFHSCGVTNLGLVTGALFANLKSSAGVELVTVSEWGSPRIFRCQGQAMVGWDPPVRWGNSNQLQLTSLTGWWQSLAAADFDRDGQVDLVLGNWGRNSVYALYTGQGTEEGGRGRPLLLYHGNFDTGGRACLEGYTAADGQVLPIHGLAELSPHLPWVTGQFPTHRSFAQATLDQILGDRIKTAGRLECRWMSSLILLNRGDYFEARNLPDLAQLGPITALRVADFDGDGIPDLYGAQGFFGHNFGVARDDAGEGFFLLGRGDGNFDALTPMEAGFRLLGEQRSVISQDLDGDQQPDLIVGEQGGPVTLLLNRTR